MRCDHNVEAYCGGSHDRRNSPRSPVVRESRCVGRRVHCDVALEAPLLRIPRVWEVR